MRQSFRRACAANPPLGPRQWRTLGAVWALTVAYSKLEDTTYLDAIAEEVFRTQEPTRSHRGHVAADLRALTELESIYHRPPRPGRPPAGRGARYLVGLPAAETRPPAGAIPEETHPTSARNAPAGGDETRPPAGDPPRSNRGDFRDAPRVSSNGHADPLAGTQAAARVRAECGNAQTRANAETAPDPELNAAGVEASRAAARDALRRRGARP
jgi:hypothetical protein